MPWVLPVCSGIALGASFPPYGLAPLAWGALVPLLVRWAHASSARHLFVEAYASFLITCVIAFYWVGNHPIFDAAAASIGGLLIVPLVLSAPIAAAVPVRRRWGLSPGLLAFGMLYLSVEWSLHHSPLAFPWPLLAHTQSTLDPVRQLADLSGPSGLSGWLLVLNGSLTVVLLAMRQSTRAVAILTTVLLTAAGWAYGSYRMDTPVEADGETTALLVQPAIPASAWADVQDSSRVDTLLRLSNSALDTSTAELVIWPETALYLPADSTTRLRQIQRLRRWTRQRQVALLTGAIEAASPPAAPHGQRYYNAALLIDSTGVQQYRKNYLVPFAEHVPFSEYLPRLRAFRVPAGGVAGYVRGHLQPTLTGSSFRTGALVCFESLFTHHVRAYVSPTLTSQPVDFLTTVAQDGWWGPSPGYKQHLAFSQIRAIATRRAMAFVTVTGQTALIDPQGRLQAPVEWMDRTTRRVSIPHVTTQSPYIRHGDWLSTLALLSTGGLAILGIVRVIRRRLV